MFLVSPVVPFPLVVVFVGDDEEAASDVDEEAPNEVEGPLSESSLALTAVGADDSSLSFSPS